MRARDVTLLVVSLVLLGGGTWLVAPLPLGRTARMPIRAADRAIFLPVVSKPLAPCGPHHSCGFLAWPRFGFELVGDLPECGDDVGERVPRRRRDTKLHAVGGPVRAVVDGGLGPRLPPPALRRTPWLLAARLDR